MPRFTKLPKIFIPKQPFKMPLDTKTCIYFHTPQPTKIPNRIYINAHIIYFKWHKNNLSAYNIHNQNPIYMPF